MIRPSDISIKSAIANHCEMKIQELTASIKRPRTTEDFLRFCDVVLSYANYPEAFYEDDEDDRKIESPLNSIGESTHASATSDTSSRSSSLGDAEVDNGTDEDAWSMVTCWCGKPFAGRPMIECESCLVWLHLSCARVRKSNIPKHFKCARCKPSKGRRKRVFSENSDMEYTVADRSEPSSPTLVLNGKTSYSETTNSNESKKVVKRRKNSVGGSASISSLMEHYQSSSASNSAELEESPSNSYLSSSILKDDDNESLNYQLPVSSTNKNSAVSSVANRIIGLNNNVLLSNSKKLHPPRRSAPLSVLPRRTSKKAPRSQTLVHENDDALAIRLNYAGDYFSDN